MTITLRQLTVRRGGRTILGPLDWTVDDGQRWVVLGANGSGKTTLLSVAGMSLWPTFGSVEVLGARYGKVDARELRRRDRQCRQRDRGCHAPGPHRARSDHDRAPRSVEPWWHVYDGLDRARATDLGRQLGLDGRIDQPFGSLSAGEQRRTSIARALMPDPDLLLLDEPTASLDLAARELLLRDLARLAQAPRPAAIVLVSHHLEEIPEGFAHALVLARGRALASGPVGDVLRDDVLSEAFGIPLAIEHLAGRWSARMRLDDTRTSSASGRMLP